MKKIFLTLAALAFSALAFAGTAEDTVKAMLPDAAAAASVVKLTAEDIAAVQTALGNKMPVRDTYEIYISKTGVVVIEEQMGKWAPIKLAVLLDAEGKSIVKIEIISMNEKRGQGVKQGTFLNQFSGKAGADLTEIGRGIRAVSGATVSAKAVFIAAKRALVVYGIVKGR